MSKIVYKDDPILRQQAKPVADVSTPAVQKLIADMKKALTNEKFGVAIAAPQIGESLRMFVVAGKVFAHIAQEENEQEDEDDKEYPDEVFINPKILKLSRKKRISNEGCLSIPGKYGIKVKRSDKVTVSYADDTGAQHEHNASGFLAQVFQHEIDHLDGILYTDHALEVIDVDENLKPLDADEDIHELRNARENQ